MFERVGISPSLLAAIPGVVSLGLGEADALDLVGPMVSPPNLLSGVWAVLDCQG